MATARAKELMVQEAQGRLDAATSAIAKRVGVTLPAPSEVSRDAEYTRAAELVRLADILESVLEAVEQLAMEGEPPAGYAALTVPMLRAEAKERDLEVPRGATKDDLVAALEADDAAKAEASDDAEPSSADEPADDAEPQA